MYSQGKVYSWWHFNSLLIYIYKIETLLIVMFVDILKLVWVHDDKFVMIWKWWEIRKLRDSFLWN